MSARTSDPEAGLPAYDEDKKGVEVGHLEESVTVKGADKIDLTGYVYVPDTPEERALVRKIDIHILPMLWVMYIMNYWLHIVPRLHPPTATDAQLDRTNIGNAKVGGMQKDLSLSSSEYSLVLSIFFIGYLLWEVPSIIGEKK
ncbi:major facilitator superfamily transporter [Trichosporon asahii var. asahii CBS 8904]|uniref:Major facilitator superfamily transporter n=1 Tax=Trichosporon asahii var. asahii (strain CBS 8904) TaxID=1220162 RepID=K1V011_TRIAC|nr:major facilitator superfamily transporter [Trichosporon asahii var. asahii CBS 8904]